MIKVAVVITFGDNWLGGINYFRNLMCAVYALSNRKIEFVIFTNSKTDETKFQDFPSVQIIRSDLLNRFSIRWWLRKIGQYCFRSEYFLEKLLKRYSVQVISHSEWLGRHSAILPIAWIPDFQHIHLPDFYSESELVKVDSRIKIIAKYCSSLIVSSQDALNDLYRFAPEIALKTSVLNFAIKPFMNDYELSSLEVLQARYHFSQNYFLLPNQFWAHKNHRVVVDALIHIKSRNKNVLVIATGNTQDSRNPDYFPSLMEYVRMAGAQDQFRVLGIIPFKDLLALMKYSIAIINPSLFEGWSTTVEEARSIGKKVILSNINVHKEQNPDGASYFEPYDSVSLANILLENFEMTPLCSELNDHHATDSRYKAFAENYQNIVLNALR